MIEPSTSKHAMDSDGYYPDTGYIGYIRILDISAYISRHTQGFRIRASTGRRGAAGPLHMTFAST